MSTIFPYISAIKSLPPPHILGVMRNEVIANPGRDKRGPPVYS